LNMYQICSLEHSMESFSPKKKNKQLFCIGYSRNPGSSILKDWWTDLLVCNHYDKANLKQNSLRTALLQDQDLHMTVGQKI
jgi:hypothetical protein